MRNVFQKRLIPHVILLGIIILFAITRLYALEYKAAFNWDQINNAWKAYNILIEGKYPLVGMQAKLNSGIFIGPLYYYFIAPFYYLTAMDPIASPIIAVFSAAVSMIVLYWVTKKLFNPWVALISILFATISVKVYDADLTQWPVSFVPAASYLILFFLFQVLAGKPKYLIHLGIAVGVMEHLHFTAIFFPIIILCTLPWFPRTKNTLIYGLIGCGLGALFLIPNILYYVASSERVGSNAEYVRIYFHGLHATRVFQLTHDAFIKFNALIGFRIPDSIAWLFYPAFCLAVYYSTMPRRWLYIGLYGLWFAVPWFVFSMYRGELSDYYFNSTMYIAISIIAYLFYRLWTLPSLIPKVIVIGLLGMYAFDNLPRILPVEQGSLMKAKRVGIDAANRSEKLPYSEWDGSSYVNQIYMWRKDHGIKP